MQLLGVEGDDSTAFSALEYTSNSNADEEKRVKSNYRSSHRTPEELEELPEQETIEFQILLIETAIEFQIFQILPPKKAEKTPSEEEEKTSPEKVEKIPSEEEQIDTTTSENPPPVAK